MNRAAYQKMTQPFRDHPKLAQSLHTINRILTGIVFFAYPSLLLFLFWRGADSLGPSIAVPLSGFLLVSALRKVINRPRPYEAFGLAPVIPKDTRGRSFPSRHVFSAAVIAATFLAQGQAPFTAIGGALFLFALLLGAVRVLAGVHYISDVAAALACAGIGLASYGIWL